MTWTARYTRRCRIHIITAFVAYLAIPAFATEASAELSFCWKSRWRSCECRPANLRWTELAE